MKPVIFLQFVLALVSWNAVAGAAEPPFAPLPNVPDYIATVIEAYGSGPPRSTRTVTHHDGWSRIDIEGKDRRATAYVNSAGPVSIIVGRDLSGALSALSIRRGIEEHRSSLWDYDAFKTNEQDRVLGEICDIWNVARHETIGYQNKRRELKRLSCISRDGIELWNKFVSEDGTRTSFNATSIARRPVSAQEVLPSADILALKSWISDAAYPSSPEIHGDAIVTMKPERVSASVPAISSRVVRRHYPWTYSEDVQTDGRRRVSIEGRIATISYEVDSKGRLVRLTVRKEAITPVSSSKTFRPKELDRRETILNETCNWFNMTPGMADGYLGQCRTEDGLVLIERGTVSLSQVLPPPAILTRSNWGIPD